MNDPTFLDAMMADADERGYQTGPYWRFRAERSADLIRQIGLDDFRATPIIEGYGDSFLPVPSFSEALQHVRHALADSLRVRYLLDKYTMPPSVSCSCREYVEIDGEPVSILYLSLLDEIDHIAQKIDLSAVRSLFEIGGGFGANIHLLLSNFPNIRQVVLLDIPPTLYVATQYLRQFYPVRDYRDAQRSITGDGIITIAPWQIGNVPPVDLFWNAHSMVEMPHEVAAGYASRIVARRVMLLSYGGYNLNTTWHPDQLPGLFPQHSFERTVNPPLYGSQERYLFTS